MIEGRSALFGVTGSFDEAQMFTFFTLVSNCLNGDDTSNRARREINLPDD
jgi:hypothetical protein